MTGMPLFAQRLAKPQASPGLDPGVASVKPKVVETKPRKVSRSTRVTKDEDELGLAGAK